MLIVDDVITAGTAVRESIDRSARRARPLRASCSPSTARSAGQGQHVRGAGGPGSHIGIPVITIITLDHLIEYLEAGDQSEELGVAQEPPQECVCR